jgi:glycosyltransferase involved in cell wall biosynthesis
MGGAGADSVQWSVDGRPFAGSRWALSPGRHVVRAVSARGEAAEVVERAGAGVVVAPEDPVALAAALRALAADRERARAAGRAGRAAVAAEHSRERSVDAWLALLERVTGEAV